VRIIEGDCLEVMRQMDEASIDAIVTDPPYGLEFMGRNWDAPWKAGEGTGEHNAGFNTKTYKDGSTAQIPNFTGNTNPTCRNCGGTRGGNDRQSRRKCRCDKPEFPNTTLPRMLAAQQWHQAWATEALRVLKPGGHLLAFGGTRTYHRLACAVEDAGFEIRDSIAHLHTKVSKPIDILSAWQRWSETARPAGVRFARSLIEAGRSTASNGSAPEPVLLSTSLENSPAAATIAELALSEARHTDVESWRSALALADETSMESSALVTIAGSSPANPEAKQAMEDSSAGDDAPVWLNESTVSKLKGVEALRIWLGSSESSRRAATDALCAALTDDLRLITLSQSETFRSSDTTLQMASVSATTVTTTASTVASLISFTADTLARRGGDAEEASVGPLAWVYGSGFP
jgi:hypothetical protein